MLDPNYENPSRGVHPAILEMGYVAELHPEQLPDGDHCQPAADREAVVVKIGQYFRSSDSGMDAQSLGWLGVSVAAFCNATHQELPVPVLAARCRREQAVMMNQMNQRTNTRATIRLPGMQPMFRAKRPLRWAKDGLRRTDNGGFHSMGSCRR